MKRLATFFLIFLLTFPIFAGDIAKFANFGFSDDSRYFMFGFYGVTENGTGQYSELYVVDVAGNRFVPHGAQKKTYDNQPDPGQDGFGAMLTLYRDTIDRYGDYHVNHMESGRLLYLLVDGEEPKPVLSFRDFETGRSYRVELLQSTFGEGKDVSASFHINLTVTTGSDEHYFTVGLPDYRRDGVESYQIRRIYSAPDDEALVFIVEKQEYAERGFGIRYMVESVEIR